jgi:hypothetical protein
MRTACLCLLLVAAPALADAIDVSLTSHVPRGKVPTLQVHILEPIAGFKLDLTRNDGKALEVKGGGKPGVIRTIDLEQPEGRVHWSGALTINLPDGTTGAMELDFDAEVQGPLKLQVDKRTDVDFERRQIFFTLNHPAGKVHLKVLVETGVIAFEDDVPFNAEPPGTRLLVSWPRTFDRPMLVDVRAFDTAGFYDSLELTRWQLDIPHEEVSFDSGKFDLRADQHPTLDASYKAISEAVARFGKLAPIRLYIAGHTDTVGSTEANRTLSLNRARAIGAYFRKKGLKISVLYEGFGEEALLVSTADETDEPKNRRAEYILSIEDPTTHNVPFTPKWQRL